MTDEQKIFIRGVEGRGGEVLKMLEDRGGKNPGGGGSRPTCIYYIWHNGMISSASIKSETAQIIMDNYTELQLPEQWNDGDVLVSRSNSQVMVLYEFVSDNKDADLFNAYFRLDSGMIFLHSLEVRNRFRLATDQEIERFYENLHKLHKDWDAEKKQLVDLKWKPKNGDMVYHFDEIGEILYDEYDVSTDVPLSDFGNCFRTREEAEAMVEKIKKLLNAK